MHKGDDVPLIESGSTISAAVKIISEKGFGCVGIVGKSGELSGIITDGDLRRHINKPMADLNVEDVMTSNPRTIASTTLASAAVAVMNEKKFTVLFVLDDKKPVGLIHMHDLLKAGVA